MTPLHEDWQMLVDLFPSDWQFLAKNTFAVERLRGFDSVENLFRTVLMHVGAGWSLRETVVHAKIAGIAEVSDVTLMNRLRQSETWLRRLCEELFQENEVRLDPVLKGRPVRVVDGTIIREPGKTGSQWRLHYSLRLPSLECAYFQLTPTHGKHTGEKLGRFQAQSGEVLLADAGYCHPPGIAAVVSRGADIIVRLSPSSMPLLDEQGESFPLAARLRSLRSTRRVGDWAVKLRCGDGIVEGRVCAVRKSKQAIQRAERRIAQKQQRRRIGAGTQARKYACHIIVFTTLPSSVAADLVMESYRRRWQIELTFKRLKSIAGLGHLPKQNDQSSRAWLYGKLFVALLSEKLARIGRAISPWGYHLPGAATGRQPMA